MCQKLRSEYGESVGDSNNEVGAKVRFDGGVFRHGDVQHVFHKGDRGNANRLALMKILWSNRRRTKGTTTVKAGEKMQRAHMAARLNIAEDASSFGRDASAKRKLKNLINGINRELKSKNMPVKIDTVGGIQLVVKEK